MNLRKLTALLLILLTALHSTSALAARYVTNGAYTAYAGVDEYLYLMEPDGSAKRLKADNLDILAMDETKLYYVTGDNVYSIVLKASQVAMELKDADEDALMTYRFKGLYTLGEDGVLYLGDEEVASGVLCASANSSTLYYITEEGPTLWGVSLSGGDPKEYSLKLKNPQALAAADSHLLVLDDGDATGYSAAKMKKDKTIKLPKGEATDMFLTGKTLNLYITDEEEGESLQTVNVSFIKNSGTTVAQKNTKTKEEPETEPEDEPEEEVYEEAEDEPEQEGEQPGFRQRR